MGPVFVLACPALLNLPEDLIREHLGDELCPDRAAVQGASLAILCVCSIQRRLLGQALCHSAHGVPPGFSGILEHDNRVTH